MIVAQRKENIIAVCLAGILAWSLLFVVRNAGRFQADIVNGIQQEKLQEADITMNLDLKKVELMTQHAFSNVASISMLVFVDEKNLKLDKEHMSSPYHVELAPGQGGGRLLILSNVGNLGPRDTLLTFAGEGDAHAFSLSDILVTYTDGKTERLALGTRIK